MKKVLLSCAAAVAMFTLVACGGKASKVASIYNDGAEQIEAAKGDQAKIQEVGKDVANKLAEVAKDMSLEEYAEVCKEKSVQEAAAKFDAALNGAE